MGLKTFIVSESKKMLNEVGAISWGPASRVLPMQGNLTPK